MLSAACNDKHSRLQAIALADIDAATARGIHAAAQDGVLESGDWGFELGSIKTEVGFAPPWLHAG